MPRRRKALHDELDVCFKPDECGFGYLPDGSFLYTPPTDEEATALIKEMARVVNFNPDEYGFGYLSEDEEDDDDG